MNWYSCTAIMMQSFLFRVCRILWEFSKIENKITEYQSFRYFNTVKFRYKGRSRRASISRYVEFYLWNFKKSMLNSDAMKMIRSCWKDIVSIWKWMKWCFDNFEIQKDVVLIAAVFSMLVKGVCRSPRMNNEQL